MDKSKIIKEYKKAVNNFLKAKTLMKLGEEEKALAYFNDSGSEIYRAIEWTYKNHLIAYWKKEEKANSITREIYNDHFHYISRKDNIRKLSDKMKNYSISNNLAVKIDFDTICDLKKSVRNNWEHSAIDTSSRDLRKVIVEAKKVLTCYIERCEELPDIENGELNKLYTSWDNLFMSCDKFDPKKNIYILLIGDTNSVSFDSLKHLCKIPWMLILDFNPDSKNGGLFDAYTQYIGVSPHYISSIQAKNTNFTPNTKTPYWFFANGDIAIKSTLTNTNRQWRRQYSRDIQALIENFAKIFDRKIKVVIAHDDQEQVKDICVEFDLSYEERAEYFIINNKKNTLSSIVNSYTARYIPLLLSEMVKGILDFNSYFSNDINSKDKIILPSIDGESQLSQEDYVKLEEDFEIVHRDIDNQEFEKNEDVINPIDFYKGDKISWYGLASHFDVDRKFKDSLRDQIRRFYKDSSNKMITLYHEPGVGGTTLARRIAWDFHEEYPTIILKQYRENYTADNIVMLYRKTSKPVLIVIEDNNIDNDQIRKLMNQIKIATISTVFLVVKRKISSDSRSDSDNDPLFLSYLRDKECKMLIDRLRPYLDIYDRETRVKKEKELQEIYAINVGNNNKYQNIVKRSPFYIGLVVFEKEFTGLQSYIQKFLVSLKPIQKKILLYISIVYYYSNMTFSENIIGNIIDFLNDNVREKNYNRFQLDDYFTEDIGMDSLLVSEEKNNISYWRPRHRLFAEEIMIQILKGSSDDREIWKKSLVEIALEFIDETKTRCGVQSEEMLRIVRELFITGGNDDIANEQFSRLIREIKDTYNGRDSVGRIFKKLIEEYPDEPHFWAHYARYFTIINENTERALECVNTAISLSNKNDAVLFHIKGMCIKKQINNTIGEIKEIYVREENKSHPEIRERIDLLKLEVQEAGDLFKATRDLNNELYGYISHIQVLTEIVDMGYKISGYATRAEFFKTNKEDWYFECIDDANSLLERAKQSDFDDNGNYLSNAEERILDLYDNYSQILEMWNNLLKTSNNKALIRRQIVRTHFKRASGFDRINQDTLNKIIEYMEENIMSEPDQETNINLWFQAARFCNDIDIDNSLDKLSRWKIATDLHVAHYYFYILKVLKAIQGYSLATAEANNLIKSIKGKSKFNPNKIKVYEWLGKGEGLKQLINNRDLSTENEEEISSKLKWVKGTIKEYKHPGAGIIEVEGLEVFFRPSQANNKEGITKSHEGKEVRLNFGFSYDGLRAYDNSVMTKDYFENSNKEVSVALDKQPYVGKIHVDDIVECEIKHLTKTHAFVSISGIHEKCSIYIGELADEYIKDIKEVVQVGEVIKAKVIKYDHKHGWNLSLKDINKDSKEQQDNLNEDWKKKLAQLKL